MADNAEIAETADIETDPVWSLLLQARKPQPNPFFARNVLRQVRQLNERDTAGLGAKLKSLFTVPRIAFAAAAVIALTVILIQTTRTTRSNGGQNPDIVDTAVAPAPEQTVAVAPAPAAVDDAASPDSSHSAQFDIGDYQEEIQMIDYLDGLLAVQNVEILDDEALAEILF